MAQPRNVPSARRQERARRPLRAAQSWRRRPLPHQDYGGIWDHLGGERRTKNWKRQRRIEGCAQRHVAGERYAASEWRQRTQTGGGQRWKPERSTRKRELAKHRKPREADHPGASTRVTRIWTQSCTRDDESTHSAEPTAVQPASRKPCRHDSSGAHEKGGRSARPRELELVLVGSGSALSCSPVNHGLIPHRFSLVGLTYQRLSGQGQSGGAPVSVCVCVSFCWFLHAKIEGRSSPSYPWDT